MRPPEKEMQVGPSILKGSLIHSFYGLVQHRHLIFLQRLPHSCLTVEAVKATLVAVLAQRNAQQVKLLLDVMSI